MTTHVLITGGAGFIGTHLVHACLKEGWKVGILYQRQGGLQQLGDTLNRIVSYAVPENGTELFSIVAEFQPQLVIHLASIFVGVHEQKDIRPLIDTNITFGTQVLDAMARHGVRYLVNTGTSWQHAHGSEYEPVNLYAATKQAFQDVVEYYVVAHNLRAITLKLFDTYGPGDRRPKLLNTLQRATREGGRLDMSPGEQLIDIVHVDDVARAFVTAAGRLLDGHVSGHELYAVSSGKPITLRDLVATYEKVSGRPLDIHWGGRPYRPREVMVPWAGWACLPGWSPEIGLEQGLKTCISYAEE